MDAVPNRAIILDGKNLLGAQEIVAVITFTTASGQPDQGIAPFDTARVDAKECDAD